MNHILKYFFCIATGVCLYVSGHAGAVDTLHTKADVLLFLSTNNSNINVLSVRSFLNIYKPERVVNYSAHIDTYEVPDPVTRNLVQTTVTTDAKTRTFPADTPTKYPNYIPKQLNDLLNTNPWSYHKVDIDGNGYTDIILDVDQQGVYVIMDMGNKLVGHLLMDCPDFSYYSFKKSILLTDNTKALLLKRNNCKREHHSHTHDVTTDTLVYMNNCFLKYNTEYKGNNILKVVYQYTKSTGFGEDGTRCIEVNSNGHCYLSCSGASSIRTATIEKNDLNTLLNVTSYIYLPKNEAYYSAITHATGSTFIIYYTDGTKRAISFWGYKPPIGLGYLSKSISDISKKLHWETTTVHTKFECPQILSEEYYPISDEQPTDCDWEY